MRQGATEPERSSTLMLPYLGCCPLSLPLAGVLRLAQRTPGAIDIFKF